MTRLRVAFLGSWTLGHAALTGIAEAVDVAGVWTVEDPRNAVLVEARRRGWPTIAPSGMRDGSEGARALRHLAPDLALMCNYSLILGEQALWAGRLGTVNVHPSLLPRHRGARPVAWTILEGDREAGVTAIIAERGVDAGDLLTRQSIAVPRDATLESLIRLLEPLASRVAAEVVATAEAGPLVGVPQGDGVTIARRLTRDDLRLCWTDPAERLWRLVRAGAPQAARCERRRVPMEVLAAVPVAWNGGGEPGEVVAAGAAPVVRTGDGGLRLLATRPPVRLVAGEMLD